MNIAKVSGGPGPGIVGPLAVTSDYRGTEGIMKAGATVTFPVSDVERATTLLQEVPCKCAVEALLTIGMPEYDRRRLEEFQRKGWQVPIPEPPSTRAVHPM